MMYWILRITRKLAQWVPLGVCYAVASLAADVAWVVIPVQRENAIENMARVLGRDRHDPEVRRKTRAAFRNYGMYLADFLRLPLLTPVDLEKRARFSGWEHVDEGLAAGKGVIFVSAHVGNWDLGSALFAYKGYPVNVVAETFHPKKLNDLVQGNRAQHGVKVIPLETAGRKVLGALRKNEILGLLIDRPEPEAGVAVRFFGGLTEVPAGAALLALKTGAKVVSGVIIRNPDHTYSGFLNSHFEVDLTGDLKTDVGLLTQRIMDSMESFIREYPEQWFIFRKMWPDDLLSNA
jgi:lauroyl/myristoyl acyltransferase